MHSPSLKENIDIFIDNKDIILDKWFSYDSLRNILDLHDINKSDFKIRYASGMFDYFMGVMAKVIEVGDCPVMQNLLLYLKDKDIKADELFEICSNFRRSIMDFTYAVGLSTKEILEELSYMFDKNFQGVLRFYSDSIYQKEQEINRHIKLLEEYQKAIDESAIVSKADADCNITYVNDKFIRLSGYTQDELLGNKYSIFKDSDISEEFIQKIRHELDKKGIFRGTLKNLKKNKEHYYIDTTIVKIVDPYDNRVEFMSIATDVTTLIDARLEAIRASQAKEYFLSNMSHEIRTPLNAILGFVNLLIEQNLTKQQRKYLEIILSSGENLLSIINDILDFSKLRSGEFMIEPKTFSIHEEIAHTLELFVASANSKKITITSFIDPNIPRELYADILRIKQIVSNFLSNAIKFTKNGGFIGVEVYYRDKKLIISVSDNGIGIPKEDLGNIFNAFTQAHHCGMENIQGSGLGLSICHKLATLMGGTIEVDSALGVGSTFKVMLPVEVISYECQTFNGLDDLRRLDIVFYAKALDQRGKSLLRYAKAFHIDSKMVDDFDDKFDMMVLFEEDIDEKLDRYIRFSNKLFFVLSSSVSDRYESCINIVVVSFPLYCLKLKNALSELLYPKLQNDIKNTVSDPLYGGHVLVAEDNEANQELIKILLTKYGLTYDLAQNGLEAVELFKQNSYNLILMDEQMPIMDGNEAIKQILSYEKALKLKHTPVSALTANVIKGSKERGLKSGFDAFLGKPIVAKELERVFTKYLKSPKLESKLEFNVTKEELQEQLKLSEDEVAMLLGLFLKKMKTLLPELKEAINAKDYKKISNLAHNIKGSSANFRFEKLVEISSLIEKSAKLQNRDFNYEAYQKKLTKEIEKLHKLLS